MKEKSRSSIGKVTQVLKSTEWQVTRYGSLEEVEIESENGRALRYRVKIWDVGRDPFVVQWFNDPTPAADFLERVMSQNVGVPYAND